MRHLAPSARRWLAILCDIIFKTGGDAFLDQLWVNMMGNNMEQGTALPVPWSTTITTGNTCFSTKTSAFYPRSVLNVWQVETRPLNSTTQLAAVMTSQCVCIFEAWMPKQFLRYSELTGWTVLCTFTSPFNSINSSWNCRSAFSAPCSHSMSPQNKRAYLFIRNFVTRFLKLYCGSARSIVPA